MNLVTKNKETIIHWIISYITAFKKQFSSESDHRYNTEIQGQLT